MLIKGTIILLLFTYVSVLLSTAVAVADRVVGVVVKLKAMFFRKAHFKLVILPSKMFLQLEMSPLVRSNLT